MGSRGLAVGGGALMLSLAKVQEKARRVAAAQPRGRGRGYRARRRRTASAACPTLGITLAEIAEAAYDDADDLPKEIDAGLESTDYFRPDDETFPFGTHVCVVEVFPETGDVKPLRYVSVDGAASSSALSWSTARSTAVWHRG